MVQVKKIVIPAKAGIQKNKFMKEPSFPSSNPFVEKRNPTEKEKTFKCLKEMFKLHQQLVKHIWNYSDPKNDEAKSGDALSGNWKQPGREIKFERVGDYGSVRIQDVETLPTGKQTTLVYGYAYARTPAHRDSRDGFLYYKPNSSESSGEIKFDFSVGNYSAEIKSVFDRKVLGSEEDGLHVESQAQKTWDMTWAKFRRDLIDYDFEHGGKFKKFLERVKKGQDRANAKWAVFFESPLFKIEDAESFVDEIRSCWELATKRKLSDELVPKLSGKRPGIDIYTHEDTQALVLELTTRLKAVIGVLDGVFSKPLKAHPFR